MSESELWAALPPTFVKSRDHLHQLAFFAVSPARQAAVGRMGLRPTRRGFGTPEFSGRVARVAGSMLVHEQDGMVATQTISTVRQAAEFFGRGYREDWFEDFHDPLAPIDPDRELAVVEADTFLLGDWFGFGFEVLQRLGETAVDSDDATEPQIWPEHFDAAAEVGAADSGQRASYGLSPGDAGHPEPYIYVAPWAPVDDSVGFWGDAAFSGASMGYSSLASSDDARTAALEFYAEGYRILHS